jgi:hypothetical protein
VPCRLDKTKFFVVGIGLFSGVTTALFPLSVIKTRQMAAHSQVPAGIAGSRYIARQIWKDEGIRGFYRGFGTVVFGTMPARTIYLTSLEVTKSATAQLGEQLGFSPTAVASIASAAGGAAASLSTQVVVVPIDVVSQRLMMHGVADEALSSRQDVNPPGAPSHAAVQSRGAGLSRSDPGTSSNSCSSRKVAPSAATSKTSSTQAPASAAAASRSYSSSPCLGRHLSQQPMQVVPGVAMADISRSHSLRWARVPACCGIKQHARAHSSPAGAAAVPRMNGFQMAYLIVQQEGVGGLYRGFWPSVATFVPNRWVSGDLLQQHS